jgi:hypothetical protein
VQNEIDTLECLMNARAQESMSVGYQTDYMPLSRTSSSLYIQRRCRGHAFP